MVDIVAWDWWGNAKSCAVLRQEIPASYAKEMLRRYT